MVNTDSFQRYVKGVYMKIKLLPLLAMTGLLVQIVSCAQKTPPTAAKVSTSRAPDSEKAESPWTTWSNKGTVGGLLVLKGIRENLLVNNLHDAHVDYAGYKPVDCKKSSTKFRSADGTCTDPTNPYVGAAGTAFGRNVAPEFIDQDAAKKLMTPNPAEVSKVLFTRDEFKPVPFLNMLAASWIQFMNHDWLTHGKNQEKNPHYVDHNGPASREIERTKENDVDGKSYKPSFGKTTLNDVTHWWDGSQIYGSSQEEQNKVRSFKNGRMTTVMINGREVLPKDSSLDIARNKQGFGHEITGFRDNWWVGLSMLHHLFVKEHNSIADMLIKKYVKEDAASGKWIWKNGKEVLVLDDKGLDEQVFQTARLINAAVMAKIHTVEWTPAILANDVLKKAMFTNWYGLANPQTWSKLIKKIPGLNRVNLINGINTGYTIGGIVGQKRNDYGVPFSISEEFTSVYRLHSLLPESIYMRKLDDKKIIPVPFEATRNEKAYKFFTDYDLKDMFYSFGTQHPGQLVLNNFPKFMQELKIPGHGAMDLAMVDIVRDRERGVPRYNQFRRAISLTPITSYADFFPAGKAINERQKDIIKKLNEVYGKDENGNDNVEAIDLLVGTSAEEVRPKNFGFGETMFQIFILMASRRLMADRFYTNDYRKEFYTRGGMAWIDDEGYMHKVIGRHMPELKPHMKGLETAFNPWHD
jgi:hypothetical protein